jgi:hypothetical protein
MVQLMRNGHMGTGLDPTYSTNEWKIMSIKVGIELAFNSKHSFLTVWQGDYALIPTQLEQLPHLMVQATVFKINYAK